MRWAVLPGRRRPSLAALVALLVVLPAAPAQAHVVLASTLARPPRCLPTCSSAKTIRFLATVRIDGCSSGSGQACSIDVRAVVVAQVRRDDGWRTIAGPRSVPGRLEVGGRLTARVSVDRSSGTSATYRTEAITRAVHPIFFSTDNPAFSPAERVACR